MNATDVLVLAGSLAVLVAWYFAAPSRERLETVQERLDAPAPLASSAPASPTPAPTLAPTSASPLSAALVQAVEPGGVGLGGQQVQYEHDEVRAVMNIVVDRINQRDPELELHLVSIDAVRKTVDAARVFVYEMLVTVYSKARNVTSKVRVVAEMSLVGHVAIRQLAVQGSQPQASSGPLAASEVDAFAAYEPVLAYVPDE